MKFNLNENKKKEIMNWLTDNLSPPKSKAIHKQFIDMPPRQEFFMKINGDKWELITGMNQYKILTLELDDDVLSEKDAIIFVLKWS